MRRVTAVVLLAAVAAAGCSSAPPGPDFTGVEDYPGFLRIADGYHGAFTVELQDPVGDRRQTFRWDGADFSLRQVPASPIDEWRLVTAQGMTTCYQQVDDRWVREQSFDPQRPSLLDGIEAISQYNEQYMWAPDLTPDATVEVSDDHIRIGGLGRSDGAGRLDRIEFDRDDGHLTGATFLDRDGATILTQTYSFGTEPDVVAPAGSTEGMDVTC